MTISTLIRRAAAGALALAALAAPPAVAAEPGCSLAPTAGTETRTIGERSYALHVPEGLTGDAVPLLVSIHGFGGSARVQETWTGWSGFAGRNGFAVAYPNGRPSAGTGAWDPYSPFSPDVAFLRAVVADVAATTCIDPDRVHADGWSNGAVMSQRLACDAADLFASVTSYGGGTPAAGGAARPCEPSRPISVGLLAGEWDFTYAGLASNTQEWLGRNGCAGPPARTQDAHGTTDLHACAGGTQVLSRVVRQTSHEWPSGARGEDQRQRMWAFLQANPRP